MILQEKERKKLRIRYAVACIILVIVEVLIALYVHDDLIRPYLGDVLVVVVVYLAVRILRPVKCKLLPLYVFLFAAGVEVLQYFDIVKVLGLQESALMRVMIGSVFDLMDIVCYGLGCVLLGVYEWRVRKIPGE